MMRITGFSLFAALVSAALVGTQATELLAADTSVENASSSPSATTTPEGKPEAAAESEPPATVVPSNRDGDRHRSINARARQGEVELLFIGDSITQGWEVNGRQVWEQFYGSRKAMNAGISGDRTQHVLWRLDNGNVDGIAPKLAVVMIGTNNVRANTAEEIAAGIESVVSRLQTKLPQTKVLLLGVFPRSRTADDELRVKLGEVNKLIAKLGEAENVRFVDIGEQFLGDDGELSKEIMPDYLHLSPEGYKIWAEAIEGHVVELMGSGETASVATPVVETK